MRCKQLWHNVIGLIICTQLVACVAGNYLQVFDKVQKDYQKTKEIQPLIEALNSSDLRMRVLAASYLGETMDPRAVEPLQKALADRSRPVREEAKTALEKLGHSSQNLPQNADSEEPLLEGTDVQKALATARLLSSEWAWPDRLRTSVKSLAFSPAGRFMVAGYFKGGYLIWDLKEGHLFNKRLSSEFSNIFNQRNVSVQYSDDGKLLSVGDSKSIYVQKNNGTIIWKNKHAHAYLFGRSLGTTTSMFSEINILISGGLDGAIKVWDLQNGQLLKELKGSGPAITSIAIAKNSKQIAASDQSGQIFIWDLKSYQLLRSFQADPVEINSLAFLPDSHFLISGGNAGVARICDSSSGALYRTLKGHRGPIKSVAVSKNGRLIATGGNDLTIKIWDSRDGHLENEFKGHSGWIEAIAFSPAGDRIVSGGRDGRILVWNLENSQFIACLLNFEFRDWMVVSPTGYFNTSPDAAKSLRIQINGRSYSVEPYFQSFYKPEAIKQVLAGHRVASAGLSRLDRPVPIIDIINPVDGTVIEKDVARISIVAKDRGAVSNG